MRRSALCSVGAVAAIAACPVVTAAAQAQVANRDGRIGAGSREQSPTGFREQSPLPRYAHGFDPYDGRLESGGSRHQGYSPRTYAFYDPPGRSGGSLVTGAGISDNANADLYAYRGEDLDALSTQRGGQVFGYYYDPGTGELRHGWHYRTPASRDGPPGVRDGLAGRSQSRQILGYYEPEPPVLPNTPASEQGLARFAGEVVELSTVTDRTSNRVHVLAIIRQPDGGRLAVEMGSFARTGVREGDWIEGLGTSGLLHNRSVLLARHVSVNGLWQNIQENAGREIFEYSGRILALRSVLLRGDLEPQAIADVRLPDGSIRPTLLGSTRDLAPNLVRVGDRVALSGVPVILNDRPAIAAQRIQVEGRHISVNYARDRHSFETFE